MSDNEDPRGSAAGVLVIVLVVLIAVICAVAA